MNSSDFWTSVLGFGLRANKTYDFTLDSLAISLVTCNSFFVFWITCLTFYIPNLFFLMYQRDNDS